MVATLVVSGSPSRAAPPDGHGSLGYITVVCLAAYIVFFAFSLGPIVWLMNFRDLSIAKPRPGDGRIYRLQLGPNFLVSMTFPIMTQRLGSATTFLTYAGLGVLTLLFVIAKVPETKGKTLERSASSGR